MSRALCKTQVVNGDQRRFAQVYAFLSILSAGNYVWIAEAKQSDTQETIPAFEEPLARQHSQVPQ